jgi:hypothetical protein
MTAMNRSVLKPSFTQRLLRSSGVRNRLFPATKLDRWAAHPRPPYTGLPSKRILKKIDVTRTDLNGRPVYQVSPRLVGGASSPVACSIYTAGHTCRI